MIKGTFDHYSAGTMTLTHPGQGKPTQHKIAPDAQVLLNGAPAKLNHLRPGDKIELDGEPAKVVRAAGESQIAS